MESKIHVKAFMDYFDDEDGYEMLNHIKNLIPYKFDDDVFEFDIIIKNVKDVTEEVGVDEEGSRAFRGVEVTNVEDAKEVTENV